MTATILNEICGQVSFDSSSPDVRLAVIQGLEYIIENMPLSHITLKRYLQHIGKLIHDISLKNRMALVDLLLTVRKLPDIKYSRSSLAKYLFTCVLDSGILLIYPICCFDWNVILQKCVQKLRHCLSILFFRKRKI